ncbi:Mpo1 family 2-hydroxy fatty acid dioxygenase [Porticoccus sp. GXU_MW_L64]
MKTQQQWFEQYAESHQHPTNKRIHNIAVPAIYWSITALLWSVSVFGISLAFIVVIPALAFYGKLSRPVLARMLLFTLLCWGLCALIDASLGWLWQLALAVFVIAWVAQFIGHHVEGKRPSFFTDLAFLLIGPAWIFMGSPGLERKL